MILIVVHVVFSDSKPIWKIFPQTCKFLLSLYQHDLSASLQQFTHPEARSTSSAGRDKAPSYPLLVKDKFHSTEASQPGRKG